MKTKTTIFSKVNVGLLYVATNQQLSFAVIALDRAVRSPFMYLLVNCSTTKPLLSFGEVVNNKNNKVLNNAMGGWGSKVLNFIVKKHIHLFDIFHNIFQMQIRCVLQIKMCETSIK